MPHTKFRRVTITVRTKMAGVKRVVALVPERAASRGTTELGCVVDALARLGGFETIAWGQLQALAQHYKVAFSKVKSMMAAASHHQAERGSSREVGS